MFSNCASAPGDQSLSLATEPPSQQHRLRDCLKQLGNAEHVVLQARDLLYEFTDDARGEAEEQQPKSNSNIRTQATTGQSSRPMQEDIEAEGTTEGTVTFISLKRYLEKEIRETNACLALPGAIVLFAVFLAAYMMHFRLETLHAMDKAVTWDIEENANFAFSGIVPFENGRMGHKTVYDVNAIPDFWSWMTMGIVPLWWPDSVNWGVNEVRTNIASACASQREAVNFWSYNATEGGADAVFPAPCPEKSETMPQLSDEVKSLYTTDGVTIQPSYLYFHSIVGGVRLLQERRKIEKCVGLEHDEELVDALHIGDCVELGNENWLKPEPYQARAHVKERIDQQDGETVYLLSGWSQKKVREVLFELENKAWLSPLTQKIHITFTIYNPNLDILTCVHIMFFMNQGGHIHKILDPTSIWLHPYHDIKCYIVDIIWALLIFKIFVEEGIELIRHCKEDGPKQGLKEYMGLGNFVDWISVFYSFCLIAFWLLYLDKLKVLRGTLKLAESGLPGSWPNAADRITFYEQVDALVEDQYKFSTLVAIYPFVIVSRFFKAFSAQPRLALVTETIRKASVDLIHYGVVFFVIFALFSVSAFIQFGQELDHFAEIGRAFHTTFRILLGDFDWEEMIQVGRVQSYIWFTIFFFLMNWIMLNMLLAIVMDKYTTVKGSIGEGAETLWSQTYEIFARLYEVHIRGQVTLAALLEEIDDTPDDTELIKQNLEEEIHKIRKRGRNEEQVHKQTEKIIAGCSMMLKDDKAGEGDSTTESLRRVKSIEEKLIDFDSRMVEIHQYLMIEKQRADDARRAGRTTEKMRGKR